MILTIGRWARLLDDWLQTRLGRPYNILLAIGLVSEIIGRVRHFPEVITSATNEVRLVFVVALEIALLIHQIAYLSHHAERRHGLRPGRSTGRRRDQDDSTQ